MQAGSQQTLCSPAQGFSWYHAIVEQYEHKQHKTDGSAAAPMHCCKGHRHEHQSFLMIPGGRVDLSETPFSPPLPNSICSSPLYCCWQLLLRLVACHSIANDTPCFIDTLDCWTGPCWYSALDLHSICPRERSLSDIDYYPGAAYLTVAAESLHG